MRRLGGLPLPLVMVALFLPSCRSVFAETPSRQDAALLVSDFESEFEGMPAGWHPAPALADASSTVWARSEGISNTRCLRLDVDVSYSAWQSKTIEIRPGECCQFTAQVKGNIQGWAGLALAFYAPEGEPLAWIEARLYPTEEWSARSVSGQAPPRAAKVTALFYALGEGTCLLDNARVESVQPQRIRLEELTLGSAWPGSVLRLQAVINAQPFAAQATLVAELIREGKHQFLVAARRTQELPDSPGRTRLSLPLNLPAHAESGPYFVQVRLEGAAWAEGARWTRRVSLTPPGPPLRRRQYPSSREERTYLDYRGRSHCWGINSAGTLLWDGKPHLPVGCVFSPRFLNDYNPSRPLDNEALWLVCRRSLALLRHFGVNDLLLRAARPITDTSPAALQRLLSELDRHRMSYGVDLSDGPRVPLEGFWVNHLLELGPLSGPGTFYFHISQSTADLGGHLWIAQGEGDALFAGQTPLEGRGRGGDQVAVRLERAGAVRLRLTPLIVQPPPLSINFWADFEGYAARLRNYLGGLRFGPGLRFFLDPLGPGCGLAAPPVVPNSDAYRREFAQWLAERYQDVGTLCQQWAFGDEAPRSFAEAAALVPLAVLSEAGYLYSPVSERLYAVQGRHSVFWFDWLAFRDEVVGSRLRSVAAQLRAAANVPIVLRYAYTARRFYAEWGNGEGPDGLAMALDLPEDLGGAVEGAAAAGLSATLTRPLWTPAVSDGIVPAPFPETPGLIGALACAGAKGWFLQVPQAARRWHGYSDLRPGCGEIGLAARVRRVPRERLANYRPQFCFWYPPLPADLRAWNPEPGLLGVDGGWGEGMAMLKNGRWIVPASGPPPPEAHTVVSVSGPPASERYALSLEQMMRSRAAVTCVGQRTDVGVIPSLDRFFLPLPSGALGVAPQPLAAETGEANGVEVLGSTATGQVWHLRCGPLQIISVPVHNAFEAAEWLDVPGADNYYSPRQMAELLFGESQV